MPIHNGTVFFPRASRYALVGLTMSFLLQCLGYIFFCIILGGNVDTGNLEIHLRNELNASDLGNDVQDCGTSPGIIHKRRVPAAVSTGVIGNVFNSLWCEPSELAMSKVARVLAVLHDILAQHLQTHLLDGLLGEKREWV